MQYSPNNSTFYEPTEDILSPGSSVGGACVQDWFEEALATQEPMRGPRNSWGDDDEEESVPEEVDDVEIDVDEDIQADPFDDFDPDDFDDEFDDDFEEELQDEYEIEPDDDEVMDDIGSPSITIDDGSREPGLEDDDDDDLTLPVDVDEELDD